MKKRMISKSMYTETGHRLVDYPGKCSHLHGHSYKWTVALSAPTLDYQGMVTDFNNLKRLMETHIGPLDHAFIFNREDPLVKGKGIADIHNLLRATNGDNPRLFLLNENPTAENLAELVYNSILGGIRAMLSTRDPLPEVTLEYVEVQETHNSRCRYSEEGVERLETG